jgi:hypothetical protein
MKSSFALGIDYSFFKKSERLKFLSRLSISLSELNNSVPNVKPSEKEWIDREYSEGSNKRLLLLIKSPEYNHYLLKTKLERAAQCCVEIKNSNDNFEEIGHWTNLFFTLGRLKPNQDEINDLVRLGRVIGNGDAYFKKLTEVYSFEAFIYLTIIQPFYLNYSAPESGRKVWQ